MAFILLNVCEVFFCFFLSYSLVGKAFTIRSVCAGEAHVLWGWGPVYFPRQETVCPLVLCHSREVAHLHPSVSSGRKLWVICASETVIQRVSVFLCRVHFKRIVICTKSFTPSHKGAWWRARTVAPDLSLTKPMLWDFLWMPSFSRKYRVRWAHAERKWSFVVLFSCSLTQCMWIMTKLVIFCNLIIFISSSCTAVCQWAALPQLLQPSPATTTSKQRGFILFFLKDIKISDVFLTGKYHILVIVPFRWVELYGSDSVCACCESTCSSASSTGESCTASLYH